MNGERPHHPHPSSHPCMRSRLITVRPRVPLRSQSVSSTELVRFLVGLGGEDGVSRGGKWAQRDAPDRARKEHGMRTRATRRSAKNRKNRKSNHRRYRPGTSSQLEGDTAKTRNQQITRGAPGGTSARAARSPDAAAAEGKGLAGLGRGVCQVLQETGPDTLWWSIPAAIPRLGRRRRECSSRVRRGGGHVHESG